MLDFIVGLETELSEMIDGSSCFRPTVKLSQVVLPSSKKKLILDTIKNFELFTTLRGRTGFGDGVSYGNGLVMLFYGEPGTGKTMFANALANHMHKKLLVINVGTFGQFDSEAFRFLFREAKLQNALVFFDECEPLFESRDLKSGSVVNIALTEIEKFPGTIIMATNRPADLDKAMHRRITLAVEFEAPSHVLREKIWKAHIPQGVALADDVNLKNIAMKFELSGGFIKNAMLQALSLAVGRARYMVHDVREEGEENDETFNTESEQHQAIRSEIDDLIQNIKISSQDIHLACKLQIRGRLADASSTKNKYDFAMSSSENEDVDDDESFSRSRSNKLNGIICSKEIKSKLQDLLSFEKARKLLTSHWGFGREESVISSCVLFVGPPGVGKKASVAAISQELGRPVHVIESSDMLRVAISKVANRIEEKFRDAQNASAMIVIRDAEILLDPNIWKVNASHSNKTVACQLVSSIQSFSGLVVLLVTIQEESSNFDSGSLPLQLQNVLRSVFVFESPSEYERAQLWSKLIPKQTPLDDRVTNQELALFSRKWMSFKARDIKRTILDAAARAAMRPESKRFIRLDDIEHAAKIVMARKDMSMRSLRSATASMFS